MPYALNLCGLALQGNDNTLASINYFNKAIEFEPNNIAAINNLANSYKALSKFDIAEKLYLKILKINPKYIRALNNYANLKQQIGNFNGSIEFYQKALEIKPNQVIILFSLASAYQEIGNFKKCKEIANKILTIDPKNTSAHKLISSIINYKNENDHLIVMENLSKDKTLKSEQLIDLSFALGKAYEDIGNYEKSFENLEKGNKLKKTKINYQIDNQAIIPFKLFKNITKTFDDLDLESLKQKSESKHIIFICGMPRSGTTLIEQIIAAHPQVNGAGELIYLQNLIKKIL
jgi:tetratricopeptide (TPR) repeat protein